MFFRGSRYEHLPEAALETREGRAPRYKRMRFIPAADGPLGYTVREGDRPDLAAWRTLGDPEQFWRLADVNRVLRPVDLAAVTGRRIRVPAPGA